jgi:hypothetical protein
MNRQEILDRLRENEAALRAQGVAHAALFGSVARGEARPDSDIDIMVEIAPEIPMGSFSMAESSTLSRICFPCASMFPIASL